MRRKAPRPAAGDTAAARPPAPHVIDAAAVYTVASATAALGLRKECLPREMRMGRLQARKRGGRYWIVGEWLLAWLATGTPHPRWGAPARALPLRSAADRADADQPAMARPAPGERGRSPDFDGERPGRPDRCR
jgi:hypothetical protein